MKVLFPKRIDGTIGCCPFLGYRVANVQELITLLKKQFYDKESGYPGLYFSTMNPEIKIVFCGHQYEHPEGKPWSVFKKRDTKPHRWFSAKDQDQSWFNLFEDAEVVDKQIAAISAIVRAQGGIEVSIP